MWDSGSPGSTVGEKDTFSTSVRLGNNIPIELGVRDPFLAISPHSRRAVLDILLIALDVGGGGATLDIKSNNELCTFISNLVY